MILKRRYILSITLVGTPYYVEAEGKTDYEFPGRECLDLLKIACVQVNAKWGVKNPVPACFNLVSIAYVGVTAQGARYGEKSKYFNHFSRAGVGVIAPLCDTKSSWESLQNRPHKRAMKRTFAAVPNTSLGIPLIGCLIHGIETH